MAHSAIPRPGGTFGTESRYAVDALGLCCSAGAGAMAQSPTPQGRSRPGALFSTF